MRRRSSDRELGADTDTYGVSWDGEQVVVKYYPPDTRRACCSIKATITDQDKAQAWDFEQRKGGLATLHRVYLAIEKKHAGKA